MPYQPLYGAPSGAAQSMEAQNAQMGQMWSNLLKTYTGQQVQDWMKPGPVMQNPAADEYGQGPESLSQGGFD